MRASEPEARARARTCCSAAARLMKQGRKPSLEEVAEEALVSRATAYRYFPSVEALLVEAAWMSPCRKPEELFGDDARAIRWRVCSASRPRCTT